MIYSHLITYITREGVKMTDLALILIVSVVGTLITVYACGYMKDYHKHHSEFADRRRFFFAMLYENEMKEFFGEGLPRIC